MDSGFEKRELFAKELRNKKIEAVLKQRRQDFQDQMPQKTQALKGDG
jgi:hypothetical protein